MELDILLMNVRSWANLELSTLHPSLQTTNGAIPYLEEGARKKNNYTIIDNVVDELHMVGSKKG